MNPNKKYQEYNNLCVRCSGKCKQKKDLTLISCPKFNAKPKQLFLDFKDFFNYTEKT